MTRIPERIVKRFAELAEQVKGIAIQSPGGYQKANPEQFFAWSSSALHLLHGVFGKNSPHYEQFNASISNVKGNFVDPQQLDACRGIFLGAKSDVDGGFLFDLQTTISGEVFADFVTAAKAALDDGKHTVAAVLACAALEDALKRYAIAKDIDVSDKTMDAVVNALKAGGFVSGPQKGLLAAMPRIRNHAMHADWDKLTPQDAGSVIGFVEQFLLAHFG